MMSYLFRIITVICCVAIAFSGCGNDEPSDLGESCTKDSDCEKICLAICDPSPCTDQSTSFRGECAGRTDCSWALDDEGNLTPTACP